MSALEATKGELRDVREERFEHQHHASFHAWKRVHTDRINALKDHIDELTLEQRQGKTASAGPNVGERALSLGHTIHSMCNNCGFTFTEAFQVVRYVQDKEDK